MKKVKTRQLSAILGGWGLSDIFGGWGRPDYVIDGPPLSRVLFSDIKNMLSAFDSPNLFKNDLVIKTIDEEGGFRKQVWSFYDHDKLVRSYSVNLLPDGYGGTYFTIQIPLYA